LSSPWKGKPAFGKQVTVLSSVSPWEGPGHWEYILNQEERQKTEVFQEEYLRLLKKYEVFV